MRDVEAENATENSAGDDPNGGPFPRRTTHHFFSLSRFSRDSDGSDLNFKRSTECLSLVTVDCGVFEFLDVSYYWNGLIKK